MQRAINNTKPNGHSYVPINLFLQNCGWEIVCLPGHTLLTLDLDLEESDGIKQLEKNINVTSGEGTEKLKHKAM